MRRKDREMDADFAYSIIDKADFGTLTTLNEDGIPYCIPVSIARQRDKIYFHSAYQGSKIENIKRNPRVSMSFVGDIKVPPPITKEEGEQITSKDGNYRKILSSRFTTEYESAVVFGNANIIEDKDEKILGLKLISEKYVPNNMPYFGDAIDASIKATCVIRIDINKITGKRKKL